MAKLAFDITAVENPRPSKDSIYHGFIKLLSSIFGPEDIDKFEQELGLRKDILLLIAHQKNKVLGYKIGYRLSPEKFYSWSGGVAKEARGQGIAKALMDAQHRWCKENGYKIIQTKTKNQWREMLLLNIKNGFDVIGTYTDQYGEPKIILEKKF